MIVVGMLSGTSVDGLDVAVADLRLDGGELVMRTIGDLTVDWSAGLRERVLAVLPPGSTTIGEVCAIDTLLGREAAGAARMAIDGLADGHADLVTTLGQTVFHWIEDGEAKGTLQLGQPAWIVEETGLPVVSDLRARDVAAGGHGAPLASTLDALWLRGPRRRAALNLGGIANITVVGDADDPVVAFDTGPANCLLDLMAARATGGAQAYDRGGAIAARGTVDEALLAKLLSDPYYRLDPPKSTGRELFTPAYLDDALAGFGGLPAADVLATLTRLCARTVADACRAADVVEVVGAGGGMHNPTLVAALRDELGAIALTRSDDYGLPGDAKEAYLVALLGFLTWHGLPGVVPGGTGSTAAHVLGRISPGDEPLRPPPAAPAVTSLRILGTR